MNAGVGSTVSSTLDLFLISSQQLIFRNIQHVFVCCTHSSWASRKQICGCLHQRAIALGLTGSAVAETAMSRCALRHWTTHQQHALIFGCLAIKALNKTPLHNSLFVQRYMATVGLACGKALCPAQQQKHNLGKLCWPCLRRCRGIMSQGESFLLPQMTCNVVHYQ